MSYHISNNPYWWPLVDMNRISSYFLVGSSAAVVYDWALTFGQELELVWVSKTLYQKHSRITKQRQPWSCMTVLYICVRCIGILYCVTSMLWYLPSVSTTNAGCTILWFTETWMTVVVDVMLGVIMMNRIHAMYGRSKKMFIFLVVVLMASTIASGVMAIMGNIGVSGEEYVISGSHLCSFVGGDLTLILATSLPSFIWEIIALCLTVFIVIREIRQSSTGSTIGGYFAVLIKSHVLYFMAFAAVSCLYLGPLSPMVNTMSSHSAEIGYYFGVLDAAKAVQMFVLGPRLILSVREYYAKRVANSGRLE